MGMKTLVSGQPALLCPRPTTRPRITPRAAAAASCSPATARRRPSLSLEASKPAAIVQAPTDFARRRATVPPPLRALSQPQDAAAADDDAASSLSARANDALFGLHPGSVGIELILLALPAVLGQAIDPMAQLMETAYIGRLGALELASAGIGVAIFNILSKIFNIPLLSIATSFVAEDISKNASKHSSSGKLELPSVSSALVLAAGIGTVEALALFLGSGLFLKLMGVSPASPMYKSARLFLSLRALGAPANVIMLAVQGIFRGFKDTKTPVLYIGLGNLSAVVLLPLLIYGFQLGITGAAISTVASQYIIAILLMWSLSKRAVLLPPRMDQLEFSGYLKSGGMLLGRTLSILLTMTIGTSMAARQGPTAMAAHQICLQVWLAVSLLADALAVFAQALIASSYAILDYKRVQKIAMFTLKSVCASQPINALAFIFDGLYYGVLDFDYVAQATIVGGVMSSLVLLYAPSVFGLAGIWVGLTTLMGLRMAAGIVSYYSQRRLLDMSKGLKRFSLTTSSPFGRPGVSLNDQDLVKDKLLIDCGEDPDCVLDGIVALGKFDALHIGHRELAMHASKSGNPFLLSFVGMAEVLGWEYRPPIVAHCDRKRVLSSWATYCRNVVPLEYQIEFSKVRYLTPHQFVEKLSSDLRIKGVVAGENYRFGYKASGDAAELVKLCQEFGLSAFIVRSVMDTAKRCYDGATPAVNSSYEGQVSSSRVRHALSVGDMEYVSKLLGRKHRLVLTVSEYSLKERKNIIVPKSCMLNMPPADGFYENCELFSGGGYLGTMHGGH